MTGVRTVIYPVKDLTRGKALYGALLGEPYVDEPYYVGFRAGDQEIGLDPNGHTGGPVGYWHVDDVRTAVARLLAAGAEERQPVRDVGGGRLVATVADAEGNIIGLLQPG
jgi:predicted enzyme related to lactoylglutathione lyase